MASRVIGRKGAKHRTTEDELRVLAGEGDVNFVKRRLPGRKYSERLSPSPSDGARTWEGMSEVTLSRWGGR